jgi:hypothetical protein
MASHSNAISSNSPPARTPECFMCPHLAFLKQENRLQGRSNREKLRQKKQELQIS